MTATEPAHDVEWFRRFPTGGTVFMKSTGGLMTTPAPDPQQDLIDALRAQLESMEEQYSQELARLRERPTQDVVDRITSERNNAFQQFTDAEQERVRLYSVLQDTVAGVQTWVPDLSPVPQPPATVPPEMHAAWISDQIQQRRAAWDTFVHRVVTQASV